MKRFLADPSLYYQSQHEDGNDDGNDDDNAHILAGNVFTEAEVIQKISAAAADIVVASGLRGALRV